VKPACVVYTVWADERCTYTAQLDIPTRVAWDKLGQVVHETALRCDGLSSANKCIIWLSSFCKQSQNRVDDNTLLSQHPVPPPQPISLIFACSCVLHCDFPPHRDPSFIKFTLSHVLGPTFARIRTPDVRLVHRLQQMSIELFSIL
jgi:hypothetical protein